MTCDYCTLRGLEEEAKQTNRVVTTRGGPGGACTVYLKHPTKPLNIDNDFKAWFERYPTRCECKRDLSSLL